MLKKWILIGFVFFVVFLQASKQVIRIQEPTKQTVEYFYNNHFDIAAYRPHEFIDIVVSDKEIDVLIDAGYSFAITQSENRLKENLRGAKDIPGYRNYDDVLLELLDYQAMYPDICKLYNIGYSRGLEYSQAGNSYYDDYAHPIWALKLSANVEIDEDQPNIYYMGAHHAREPISTEVVMYVLEHLVANYGVDAEITHNIDNTQIWFIPLVNPDGHKVVITELDVWWRKNIRDNNNNGVFDTMNYYGFGIDGVDLNRNYGWQWATGGASGNFSDPTYHGPAAFSEPELIAMQEIMAAHHFVAGITYHSYSELVLFPYGYAHGIQAPDRDALEELAVAMAVTIPAENTQSGHYIPMPAWDLYPASGTTDDYAYGEHGIFSYTIELATEFIPPGDEIEGICEDNLEAALILLNRINHSTLTGHITDAVSGLPVSAEVFVHEIDNQGEYRKPYKSNETFGRYYRMLTNGTYSATFSAYGYEPVTINDIAIDNEGQTILDITLSPTALHTIDGTVIDSETLLPIENVNVELYYNLDDETALSTTSDANGNFSFEHIPGGEYDLVLRHENYATYIESIHVIEDFFTSIYLSEPTIYSFDGDDLEHFSFSGHTAWFLDNATYHTGTHSARSGNIGSWQNSSLILAVDLAHAGEISFFKKVSTEANYDFFYFKINGETKGQWSGEIDWSESIYYVAEGEHTFEWIYEKDGYVDEGSDCAWIDLIQLPPLVGDIEFYPPQNLVGDVIYDTPNPHDNTMQIEWETPQPGEATLESYGVYRNYELIQTVNSSQLSFSEVNPPIYQGSEVHYYVTANYSNPEGTSQPSNTIILGYQTESDVTAINFVTELKGNYPNPFNPNTTIYFSLENGSPITLTIFNLKGQVVRTFKKDNLQVGNHQIEWNGKDNVGKDVSSGIFFYRLQTEQYQSIKKMVMIK